MSNGWYIATAEDEGKYKLWAGPYDSRAEADAMAAHVKAAAYEHDGYLWWAAWGTGLFETREPGILNNRLMSGASQPRVTAYTHGSESE